jgi:hypothetical protein
VLPRSRHSDSTRACLRESSLRERAGALRGFAKHPRSGGYADNRAKRRLEARGEANPIHRMGADAVVTEWRDPPL